MTCVRLFLILLFSAAPVFAQSVEDNILTWDPVAGATTIHIERRDAVCNTPLGTYAEIAQIAGDSVTWTDAAVQNPRQKCYRIAGSNGNGFSDYSNEAGKVPATPGMLRVKK